jgi:hypothetical protein
MTKEVSCLTSTSDVQDLRDKDIAIAAAIAAMKRKIEAKLKTRTESSDASFAQELAVSIMDKNDTTPNQSPTVQSPVASRETCATTANQPESNLPMPFSDNILPPATPEPHSIPTSILDSAQKPLASLITLPTSGNSSALPSPSNEDLKMRGLGTECDEEGRLLIQLEEQRLAEHHARERRRKLEERLAAARRQNSRSPIHAREGRVPEVLQGGISSLSISRALLIF